MPPSAPPPPTEDGTPGLYGGSSNPRFKGRSAPAMPTRNNYLEDIDEEESEENDGTEFESVNSVGVCWRYLALVSLLFNIGLGGALVANIIGAVNLFDLLDIGVDEF